MEKCVETLYKQHYKREKHMYRNYIQEPTPLECKVSEAKTSCQKGNTRHK